MSHWNYRVIRKDGRLAVHEVFYADDGRVSGYTAEPAYPRADDPDGLAEEFDRYRRALAEPVLDYAALEAEAVRPGRPANPAAAAARPTR